MIINHHIVCDHCGGPIGSSDIMESDTHIECMDCMLEESVGRRIDEELNGDTE